MTSVLSLYFTGKFTKFFQERVKTEQMDEEKEVLDFKEFHEQVAF